LCWACQGTGSFETKTDPSILADRRAKAKAAKLADGAARAAACQAVAAERKARYAADPRIGPETRARIAQFPMVGFEFYRLLSLIDAGANLPHVLRNCAP
jgi:hypothetical protein